MRFIRTDRGDYVSAYAVAHVTREPAHGRHGPSTRIFKYTFFGKDNGILGSVVITEDRMEALLADLVPAQAGESVFTLFHDEGTGKVEHTEHRVIAWAIRPYSDWPTPITADSGQLNQTFLTKRPDGKYDDQITGEYDSLEAAKAAFLEQMQEPSVVSSS
jgi:hypothetical protein